MNYLLVVDACFAYVEAHVDGVARTVRSQVAFYLCLISDNDKLS